MRSGALTRQRHAEIIKIKPPRVEPPLQLVQSTVQWGEFVPTAPGCGCPDRWRDAAWHAGSEFWPVRRVGTHRAGRLLDGRAWDQLPGGGTR